MIADSSFLIALFHKDDELHQKAVELFANLPESSIIVPDRMLEESFTVFSYKLGAEFALAFLEKLRINKSFVTYRIAESEWDETVKLASSMRKKMSFADYLAICLSKKTGEEILTFDRQVASAAKEFRRKQD
ncbi:PIN domain protein [Candidatus Anstonella stagnisolia]|nr:PIN domain protein [Candidatus Anstonella stagnisolia]